MEGKYGYEINLFRGVDFRYFVLGDGEIVLTLDTTTHYISSKSLLYEIKKKGLKLFLKDFRRELKETEKRFKEQKRKFYGIGFHYKIIDQKNKQIINMPVRIKDIVETPISKHKLNNGPTVLEYLREKYGIKKIDKNQPTAISDKGYGFAPQFLYRHIPIGNVPPKILNEQTHLIDTRNKKNERDIHRSAKLRYEMIVKKIPLFRSVKIGKNNIVFHDEMIKVGEDEYKFEIPKLRLKGKKKEDIKVDYQYITHFIAEHGLYREPEIEEVYIYYKKPEMQNFANEFWDILSNYIEDIFKITLKNPIHINYGETHNIETSKKGFVVGIVKDERDYLFVKNKLKLPSQCCRLEVAKRIVEQNKKSILENIAFALIAKAGGVPWLLYDELSYENYIAVDVGRSLAEAWAMGVILDKRGEMKIESGKLSAGDKLDEDAIKTVVEMYGGERLVLLRDGDIKKSEIEILKKVLKDRDVNLAGIVWIVKNNPFRIFRVEDGNIKKPFSGDYYILDEKTGIICTAGIDEYEHAMPRCLLVKITDIIGELKIEDVLRDVFYMTYLNWGSPGRSYSMPAPLKLAHALASEMAKGIEVHGDFI